VSSRRAPDEEVSRYDTLHPADCTRFCATRNGSVQPVQRNDTLHRMSPRVRTGRSRRPADTSGEPSPAQASAVECRNAVTAMYALHMFSLLMFHVKMSVSSSQRQNANSSRGIARRCHARFAQNSRDISSGKTRGNNPEASRRLITGRRT